MKSPSSPPSLAKLRVQTVCGSPILLSVKTAGKERVQRRRALSRREAKELTRRRLLAAARKQILAGGEATVTASRVAHDAGVAGATFYEHFANRDDLLRAVSEALFDELRANLASRRREALEKPHDEEMLRAEFRTPLEMLASNADLFRLALRVRHHAGSPLGDSSRRLAGNTRRDLVAELVARGYPAATEAERRRLEMVADIHIAATETLAIGHVSGRYPDLDELIDMLVLVTRGTRLVRQWRDVEARAGTGR
jgi:AcrR family transcriptional regulator